MKNLIIIVLFPFFITAQETKLNEELIKKSIQWTKVASTGSCLLYTSDAADE